MKELLCKDVASTFAGIKSIHNTKKIDENLETL